MKVIEPLEKYYKILHGSEKISQGITQFPARVREGMSQYLL